MPLRARVIWRLKPAVIMAATSELRLTHPIMSTISVLLNVHLISIALSVSLLTLRFGGVTPTRV